MNFSTQRSTSGGDDHQTEVEILVERNVEMNIGEFQAKCEGMILLKITTKPFNIDNTVLQAYAPTRDYTDEQLEECYEDLQKHVRQ